MNTIIEKVMLLQNVEFFADIPTEQLSFLATIAEPRTFEKGETLFAENEPSDALYIIAKGSIQLYRNKQIISKITENQAAGVLGFFDQEPRIFSAVCENTCQVLVIDAMDFFDLLEDKVHITRHLLRFFVTQLRNLYSQQKRPEKFA
ncbi:MAG: cyclic nucleotide-binding domain-containing protein [Bacteroidales bacterium]|nr:cyclic nucleotide-binding domain-containing protein [Bacteroidales bacterium]